MNSKLVKQLLLMTLLPVFLCLHAPAFATGLPPAVDGQIMPSLAPMLERSTPAVVNISTSTNIEIKENPLMQDPFFRQFFQVPNMPRHQERNSLGSGVIIDSAQGLVLTNNHVIAKADKIKVTLQDGRQLAAQLVGADAEADVAVIKIPAENLTQIPLSLIHI